MTKILTEMVIFLTEIAIILTKIHKPLTEPPLTETETPAKRSGQGYLELYVSLPQPLLLDMLGWRTIFQDNYN